MHELCGHMGELRPKTPQKEVGDFEFHPLVKVQAMRNVISNGFYGPGRGADCAKGHPVNFGAQNDAFRSELSGASHPGPTSRELKKLLAARRARDLIFGANLFDDPAWDILLQAYLARLDQERLSITALCHASAVPSTTALRWLNKLEQEGWLSRRNDPLDGRRSWIELSDKGQATMDRYWSAVWRSLLPV